MNYVVTSTEAEVGDLVFAHTDGIVGRAIRIAESLRWKGGSLFNHVAIVNRIDEMGVYVVQATPRGVTDEQTIEQMCPTGRFILVEPPPVVDRDQLVQFARMQVGSKYGFVTIFSVLIDIITPNWFPALRRANSWICSGLAAESLRAGGWLHNWPDIYLVTPAQLFQVITKLPPK